VGFFGMVYVLEARALSLAVRAATRSSVAQAAEEGLHLPAQSRTLDLEHIEDLGGILDG